MNFYEYMTISKIITTIIIIISSSSSSSIVIVIIVTEHVYMHKAHFQSLSFPIVPAVCNVMASIDGITGCTQFFVVIYKAQLFAVKYP